jgi:dihydrofolate synthase/folylpolyglutamate synthase
MLMPRNTATAECLETMFALRRFGIKLGLATIRRMLSGLDNPQRRYRCIHIAGTNGKGSVASTLATILMKSGYRVGLYTSPHLVRFNERIQVDGEEISDAQIVRLFRRVQRTCAGGREPTFFEFTTAMALDEFARRKVDWAVIETGMGGRLDATNAITPELSVITNVSREHREYLGDTIDRIAFEKAGIVKRRKPVVTGVRQSSAFSVLSETAQQRSAPLHRLGSEFRVRRRADGTFTYSGIEHIWTHLATGLRGEHQVQNAALVLAACELLMPKAPRIDLHSIRAGLIENRWPGRLEVVSQNPLVVFDGAHNLDAARQLSRWLSKNLRGRPLTLVVGILDDKPYRAMLKRLVPLASRVIFTQAKINRALPAKTLVKAARPMTSDISVITDVAHALKVAVKTAPAGGLTLVAGSLYVVGEAQAAIANGIVRLNR